MNDYAVAVYDCGEFFAMHIPNHPSDEEKYRYLTHHQWALTICSLFSFFGVLISSYRYFTTDEILYVFFPFLFLSVLYYVVSVSVQGLGTHFDHDSHIGATKGWKPNDKHSVDIFLPTCGEELSMIQNTWSGVRALRDHYNGKVKVYSLDDGNDPAVKAMAEKFGFTYLLREDRSSFKKSGNLHHGYKNSESEFVAIFDADFKPRADFLDEILPYFDKNPALGIVQTPQFFDVQKEQHWLERGAGSVQEYFYRSVQQNRQQKGGAICVGTNAVYRRAALDANNGPTLIMHSEDVHTGFDLGSKGWQLLYLPLILAKGVCPNSIQSFFRQQYRWCKGSMSLFTSKKFWQTKLSLSSRMCYFSGFLYYINTGIFSVVTPLIPLSLLLLFPEQAHIVNYLLLIPAYVYILIVLPAWHHSRYRSEVFTVKFIYGWAHLFAMIDTVLQREMPWQPTGSANEKTLRFRFFRAALLLYALPIGVVWMGTALWYMVHWSALDFGMLFLVGSVYVYHVLRVLSVAFEAPLPTERGRLMGFGVASIGLVLVSYLGSGVTGMTHGFESVPPLAQTALASTEIDVPEEQEVSVIEALPNGYFANAMRGDSLHTLSRKIITEYTEDYGIALEPWQKMYVETRLAQTNPNSRVFVGQRVRYENELIQRVIDASTEQLPVQQKQWAQYARRAAL